MNVILEKSDYVVAMIPTDEQTLFITAMPFAYYQGHRFYGPGRGSGDHIHVNSTAAEIRAAAERAVLVYEDELQQEDCDETYLL